MQRSKKANFAGLLIESAETKTSERVLREGFWLARSNRADAIVVTLASVRAEHEAGQ